MYGGNHGDSKTMTAALDLDTTTADLGRDLGRRFVNDGNNGGNNTDKILGNNSMTNADDDTKDDGKQQTENLFVSRSHHSDSDDCFLDDEEEQLSFPLLRCESQSLFESVVQELKLVFNKEHFGKVDLEGLDFVDTCDNVIMGSHGDKDVLLNSEEYHETIQYKEDNQVMVKDSQVIQIPGKGCLSLKLFEKLFVGPRSILWGHRYRVFQTSADSAAHEFQSHGGSIVACALLLLVHNDPQNRKIFRRTPPPYGTQFFCFHKHFHRKVPTSEVHAPPNGSTPPPYGKSWIRPAFCAVLDTWVLKSWWISC